MIQPVAAGGPVVLTLDREGFGDIKPAILQVQLNTAGALSPLFDCTTAPGNSVDFFDAATHSASNAAPADGSALDYWSNIDKTLDENLKKTLISKLEATNQGWKSRSAILGGEDLVLRVHLPSGAVAAPTKDSVSEGKWIQVAVLLPESEERLPTVTRKDCEVIHTFRQKPAQLVETSGVKSNGKRPKNKQSFAGDKFKLVAVGEMFRCGAGKMSYQLHPLAHYVAGGQQQKGGSVITVTESSAQEEAHELRVRPRYHLAATAMLGFDTATHRRFETDASDIIQEVKDREGLAVYVGAVWMIGGVDYEAMSDHNYFLNLFVAVKPTSPTEDAVVGLALTPTGSLSLAAGLSLHKNKRLTEGYAVGAGFTGDGDIPTEKTWTGMRPGLFLGLAIDSNIFDALSKTFQPAK
ncbi:hypothetical protein ACN469_35535 [Corallococcus terminator]